MQITGVYSESLVEPIARVCSNLGVKRGFIFYGSDGMDEVTVTGSTKVCEINNGNFRTYDISPEVLGLGKYDMSKIVGGDGEENAQITKDILSGKTTGAKRDIVVLNASLGLYAGGKADSVADGVKLAQQIIDNGSAYNKMIEFVNATNE
jgi:anthranilate phosphoribosyltransferase